MLYWVQLRWCLVPTELSHPDMILLVCAYICLPLRSAQPYTYRYCAALCKLFLFLFLHLETQPRYTCQKRSSRSFVELENQGAENIHNNTNDDNDIQFWQLQKPLHVEWTHLFRRWGVHAVRSGFSPVATKLLQLGVAAGRQQICETVRPSEGCNIFPGKTKQKDCSRGGSHKSKRLDLSLSINNLLLCQQTGLSHFPNFFW